MKSKKHNKKICFLPRIKIKINKKCKSQALNAIIQNNLNYLSLQLNNEFLEIEIYSNRYKQYNAVLSRLGIEFCVGEEYGLLSVFKKNKNRVGILIGAVFLLFATSLSTKFVWKININGNSQLTNEEVLNIAGESGLRLGTYIPSIDYDKLHNQIMLSSDKISWISVNINGSIANIEVKETEKEIKHEDVLYTNIVSKFDGQILSVEAINGEKKVKPGDIVKTGELLISGVIDSQASGLRYENAKGSVYAYVNKKIIIEVPRVISENIFTKKVHTDRQLKIFSNIIKISLKHSNCGEFCGKIEKKEDVKLFGKYVLPISLLKTEHFIVETQEKTYTNQEMVDFAFNQLDKRLESELKNAQLVSKSVKTSFKDGSLILECDIYCVEDIAREVEYYVGS